MDDPREEQATELEALEAIFGPDFRVVDQPTASSGARFEIDVVDDAADDVKLRLIFTHPLAYPADPLMLVVHALEGLSSPLRKELHMHLEEVARQHVEEPAVFTVCEAARAWIAENVGRAVEEEEEEEDGGGKFETLDATRQDKVEVISSKAIGTPVTVEAFNEWRERFFEELEGRKSRQQLEKEANRKPTGRQMFESRAVVVSAESESFWEAEASQGAEVE